MQTIFAIITNDSTQKGNSYFAGKKSAAWIVISLFLGMMLSSCSQPDTVAPVTETHSGAREDASVLNKDEFEEAKIASFWRPNFWTPTAGTPTKNVKRTGKQALRISWKPSQADGTNKMLHSELSTPPLPVGETERWYGYSSFMPSSSMADDNQPVIISQWHGVPGEGEEHTMPVVAFSIEPNSQLQLIYRASNKPIVKFNQSPTSQKVIALGKASFDRWVDYVVHVKWDPTGKTGQLQVWQDGKLIVDEQGISIGYMDAQKPFWKAGLYCYRGQSKYSEKVIYYDEMRIGSASAGYDAVKPGRSDNSAKAQW